MTSPTPPAARPADHRTDGLVALGLAALALITRLTFVLAAPDRAWPHSILYEGDAPVWVEWARALHAGQPFEFDLPLRTPGVAWMLHWLAPGVIDPPFLGWKILWCGLSAAACGIAYICFRQVFARRVAVVAGVLLVFSYGSLVTATSLNNETPYTLLLVLLIWGTLSLHARPRRGRAITIALAVGAAHGVATLMRAEHTLLMGMMLVWSGWVMSRRSGEPADESGPARSLRPSVALAIVLVASVVVCLPWSMRGSAAARRFNVTAPPVLVLGESGPTWTPGARAAISALPGFAMAGNSRFIESLAARDGRVEVTEADVARFFQEQFDYVPRPISTWALVSLKGPLDFALANHPEADGGFSRAALEDGLSPDPPFAFGRPSHLKLFNRGYREGLGYIRADPGHWLGLVGRKLGRFADGITLGLTSMNLPYGDVLIRRPVDLATPPPGARPWWRVGILGAIVAGMVLAGRDRRGAVWLIVIAYKLIVTTLFYGYARQAVSIQPAFAIFIAVSVDAVLGAAWRRPGETGRRWLGLAGIVVVAGLLACEGIGSLRSRSMDVRPLTPRGRIAVNDALAPGAIISNDLIELRPAAPAP